MTSNNAAESRGRSFPNLALGVAILAVVAFGTFSAPAYARWHDRDDHHAYHRDWDGGWYRSPPVVYGGPYGGYGYYPPPVVYGPGVGFSINIR